jgi:hypothetical protein
MPYGNPPPALYGRSPVMPPWLTATLVVGAGLAVGALISRTAMAALKTDRLPLPAPSKEPLRLGVQRTVNAQGQPHATFVSTDPRVAMIEEGQGTFVKGPLPARIMVSVPEDMEVTEAIAGMGGKLLAGEVGKAKDFIFEASQYSAEQALPELAGSENYNAIVTVRYQIPEQNLTATIPMPIYTAPG